MYYVYKYIDPGTNECMYIGQTKNLNERHLNHLKNKEEPWCKKDLHLYYIEVPDKYNLNFLEMYFINLEKPKYNVAGTDAMDVNFAQIQNSYKWEKYDGSIYNKEDINTVKDRRKLTLHIEQKYINALKISAIYHDVTTSELVEIFGRIAEKDKKLLDELVDKFESKEIKDRREKKKD